jgi:hypothetical protein
MTNTDRQALEEIASMTLWGEPIKDEEMQKTAIEAGEYDEDEGVYNPSADTECNMLRDAVETARQAIERKDVTARLLEALREFVADKAETIKSQQRQTISYEDRMFAEARAAIAKAEAV